MGKRRGRERRRGEGERAMGTECLCKTKDSEESGGEGGTVDTEEPSWQQETAAEMS